jgi:hypothetical protein
VREPIQPDITSRYSSGHAASDSYAWNSPAACRFAYRSRSRSSKGALPTAADVPAAHRGAALNGSVSFVPGPICGLQKILFKDHLNRFHVLVG